MIAFACPTIEAAGQPAGLASNCAAEHAFCNVVSLDGSCLGEFDFDAGDVRVYPGPLGYVSFTVRLAPPALLLFAAVETANLGANFRTAQLVTWNGTDTATR